MNNMQLLENSENQGRIIFEQTIKEFDCVTEDGVEFQIRITQDWNGMEIHSNLSEDGDVDYFKDVTGEDRFESIVEEIMSNL
jgi:hypothetical protein